MLKKTLTLLITGACIGCAGPAEYSVQRDLAHVTVRPGPREPTGVLQVYTETVPEVDGDSIERWLHQPYRIYQDGEPVRSVANEREVPRSVALPPGIYRVDVPSSDLRVRVEIREGRVTRVRAPELKSRQDDRTKPALGAQSDEGA